MYWSPLRWLALLFGLIFCGINGCSGGARPHPLNPELARNSLQSAMQAWVDGKTPKDLQPKIIMGDTGWEQGRKLVSFEILRDEETTDGSNLYIRVNRTFEKDGANAESKVTYIVGTSPVITIFPQ